MKKWNIKKENTSLQHTLSQSIGISPAVSQLLINRGLDDASQAKTFLSGSISELYNPFLMEGMHEAVQRLKMAVEKKEKILIHGDYDVDGITAITVLAKVLQGLGASPEYFIPHRLNEGYGLSFSGVEEAVKIGADLVVTVDCGISSIEEVKALNARHIDVIITDHHEAPDILPPAYSIVNPLRKGCPYPDKNLSGVAIAFKLCEALCSEFHNKDAWHCLDLVSLGTVSDVVPLIGENRIFVKEGLKLLRSGSYNKGINALIEASGIKKSNIGSFEIGFILGPRINASGRLGYAETALELLLTDDEKIAADLAKRLNQANRERQRIENFTLKEAISKIESEINFKDHKIIVLHKDDWHAGVIGIVASRISDRFNRPAILISTKNGIGKGSGRSIENFHLYEALVGCQALLEEYGGHKYACGLTILEKNLSGFKKAINEIANTVLVADDLIPYIDIDMELPLASLDHGLIRNLECLEPFGESNPQPVFCSKNLRLASGVRVIKGEHLKFNVTDGSKNFEAIGFGLANNPDIEPILRKHPEFDLAYTLSFNNWQGIDTIQLTIEDVRSSMPF